ncbi:MAG TPA: hypothetical protein VFJ98_05830 [Mycobacteriales bacterium]|nr:hypothetical protein [Mycobacteriales bacterium]
MRLLPPVAAALGAVLLLPQSAVAANPPPGWTPVAYVAGTTDVFNHVSSTAANGTDAVVWVANDTTGVRIDARVRLAGTTAWRGVTPRVRQAVSAQDLVLTPTPAGTFFLAWVRYTGGHPEVLSMTLDPRSRTWSKPLQVFHDTGYGHAGPDVAIAADGTIGVTAYARPDTSSNPPVYRVVVGMRHPDGSWHHRFLTPVDKHSTGERISANPAGDFLVSWIEGYNLSEMTVRAATRHHGADQPWRFATLSDPGDSQRVHQAIGRDGTAAVIWSATSQSFNAIRMSTTKISTGAPTWSRQDVVTSTPIGIDAYAAVYKTGHVSALWSQGGQLWTRLLSGGTLGGPVQLSATGHTGVLASLVMQPNGRAAVLYHQYSGSDNEGLRLRTLTDGVPSAEVVLTDYFNGDANQERLGINAANRHNVVWTRGAFPNPTDVASMGDPLPRPSVMTSQYSGLTVTKAVVRGTPRVGRRLSCATGFWVEAAGVSYRWYRDGSRIAHAIGRTYLLRSADLHRHLSCRATGADSAGGKRTLASNAVRVTS